MAPRLQGVFVAVGTRGGFVREEPSSIFTRRGMVREDMGDAAQVTCFPFRHIVKEVAGVLDNYKSWKSFFQRNPTAFTFGDLPDDVH